MKYYERAEAINSNSIKLSDKNFTVNFDKLDKFPFMVHSRDGKVAIIHDMSSGTINVVTEIS